MQEIREIGKYQVKFSRMDNRTRSLLRRRLGAMSASVSSLDISKLSKEEQEAQEIKNVAMMMNHTFYDEVRDLILEKATIEGEGNALKAFNGFDNCFEHDEELELNLFKEGIEIYLGKSQSAGNSGNADTRKLTQL